MLKLYQEREPVKPVLCSDASEVQVVADISSFWPKTNSIALKNLDQSLDHLTDSQRKTLKTLITDFSCLFKDTPGNTNILQHDVDVGTATPIKQYPYRLNPEKTKIVNEEVDYMLQNGLITESNSPWSSPVVLVKKDHGQFRLCFDYRKVNSVTKTDSYPIPRVDDCIDQVGNAKFISKFDMLKGYWQVGLTERAREVSAFITKNGLYECLVMPFGMKNAAGTFQRLMNIITKDLTGCVVYIDDVVIYSDDWETHIDRIKSFFSAVKDAGLVINLAKCEFARAKVIYLGHEVGFGKIAPKDSNVLSILNFPMPTTRKEVRRFLGLAGYHRKFIKNYSDLTCPLTNLLKRTNFCWDKNCQESFNKIKVILTNFPILKTPDFSKEFKLAIDASDTGVGAVLMQEDESGLEHPVAYFSKKLCNCQRKYSTIEKETLSLLLALQHFEVYVSSGAAPLTVMTDHNPLLFLNKFKNKNQRLTRWSLFLQEWNLNIQHVPGKDNVILDTLSRV